MRSSLAAVAALLLCACTGPAAPGEATSARGPTASAPAPGVVLDARCTGPGGITVAHPADWAVNPGDVVPPCTRFGPERFEVRPHSDVRQAAVVLAVEDLSLEVLAAPVPDEVARTDVVVDGRPAVRQVLVTGPGLHPEGTRITRYVVSLGEERALVADALQRPGPVTDDSSAGDPVAVLDAMMAALEIGGRPAR